VPGIQEHDMQQALEDLYNTTDQPDLREWAAQELGYTDSEPVLIK
tara:strand:- start:527 stop:661 length:135 start_codon:yes stop_codon:yes gene_type:complete